MQKLWVVNVEISRGFQVECLVYLDQNQAERLPFVHGVKSAHLWIPVSGVEPPGVEPLVGELNRSLFERVLTIPYTSYGRIVTREPAAPGDIKWPTAASGQCKLFK